MLSRCSVRIDPLVDVFLRYLWGEVNPRSFYSAILTSTRQHKIYICVKIAFFPRCSDFKLEDKLMEAEYCGFLKIFALIWFCLGFVS